MYPHARRHVLALSLVVATTGWTVSCGSRPADDADVTGDTGVAVPDADDTSSVDTISPNVTGDASDAGGDDTDVPLPTPDPLEECEVMTAWTSDDVETVMEPAAFEVSPNGGILWTAHYTSLGGAFLQRARDGLFLAESDELPVIGLDVRWERGLIQNGGGGLRMVSIPDGESDFVLDDTQDDFGARWLAATFSEDERHVVAARCDRQDAPVVELRVWNVDTGAAVADTTIPSSASEGVLCAPYESRPKLLMRGNQVFAAAPRTTVLHRWDVETGEAVSVEVVPPPGPTEGPRAVDDILAVAFAPDGRTIVASGSDGALHWVDASSMTATHTESGAVPVQLNQMRFAPGILSSPVVFSPSGRLLASAGPEGGVAIRLAETGELLHTLQLMETPPEAIAGTPNALAALRFSRDGTVLYSRQMWGTAAYTCTGEPAGPTASSDDVSVTIGGPPSVAAGSNVSYMAATSGFDRVRVHRFFAGTVALRGGTFSGTVPDVRLDAGEHVIRVDVEDGLRSGVDELTVEVN